MSRVARAFYRLRGERGQVLPLVAVAMVVLIGVTALTIDVGNAMLHKRRLQAAVDLAALSASQNLPDIDKATAEAASFTTKNWATRDSSAVATSVSTGCRAAGCTSPDKVTIDASTDVSTGFARLFGIDNIKVNAHAAACGPCDVSIKKFDVMVVLDRSASMCDRRDSNGCVDLNAAKDGIRSLLKFFDPSTDRVGLAVLSSGTPSSGIYPCEGPISSGGLAGSDFMKEHGSWVLEPLAGDFKNPDGSLNTTLDCLQAKSYTPIAPAIQDATTELEDHGRHDADVTRVIVFFGDGGANVQPMKSDGDGGWQYSWYRPLVGDPNDPNDIQPCRDAVARAGVAKAGIDMYVIGYDLTDNVSAQMCNTGNHPANDSYKESGINAVTAMQQMATDSDHYFPAATPAEITEIFNKVGRQITSGGSRLVE